MNNVDNITPNSITLDELGELPRFGDQFPEREATTEKVMSVAEALFKAAFVAVVVFTCLSLFPITALPVSAWITASVVGAVVFPLLLPKPHLIEKCPHETVAANRKDSPPLGAKLQTDVIISNDVSETFAWKKELIASAEESIECSFNYAGGEKLRELLLLMQNRLLNKPNLKIHLIISSDFLEKSDRQWLNTIQKTFPERFHYLITERLQKGPPHLTTEENHVKFLVIDEKYFVIGGSGVHSRMVNTDNTRSSSDSESFFIKQTIELAFRDSDVIGRGRGEANIAKSIRSEFFNLYLVWAYRMKKNLSEDEGRLFPITHNHVCKKFDSNTGKIENVTTRFLVCAPEFPKNPIDETLAKLIVSARGEVNIANLHYVPSDTIRSALQQTKARKAGHFNGALGPVKSTYVLQNRQFYGDLDSVYELNVTGECYHKKVLTFDGEIAFCGSYNLGRMSHEAAYESGLIFEDKFVTKLFDSGIDEDIKQAKKVDLQKSNRTYRGSILVNVLGPHL